MIEANSKIVARPEDFSLTLPHTGVSLRAMMTTADLAARKMTPYRRKWLLTYKGALVGSIQLATPTLKRI